ncbi:MAG: 7,8-didemethyl-8-hydroxy-5-deazariboflavin synthase subunit CofG [Leptolyngbyaceae cyanobacterium]
MPQTVTYSPAYTLVPTYECFNHCTYCNFRVDPGQSPWLTLDQAGAQLQPLQNQGVIEVLILSGEVHPKSPRRQSWLKRIYDLCRLALDLGFLPHTNVGPLTQGEMEWLKTVNVSMGLMLEQITPTLQTGVHRHAPSKQTKIRLEQLTQAGELRIPFTTGLLLGIGETASDRRETLEAIAQIHEQWGHIQEVILQPYSPGNQEARNGAAFSPTELVSLIALARQILPPAIALQIPPNLVLDAQHLIACLEAGATDLGGIGPRDEVNPDYPHLLNDQLASTLKQSGWQLVPRLPIYPQYEDWLLASLRAKVQERRRSLMAESKWREHL